MSYVLLGVAALAVLAIGSTLVLLAVMVLKAAHRRPGLDGGHSHGKLDRTVLRILTALIRGGLRLGIRLGPMAMLTIVGRKSGVPRTNPVDLWVAGDRRYLVATHDETAAWVRNLRAAGTGAVWYGRKRWTFTAIELSQADAAEVIRNVLGPRMRRPVAGFVLRQTIGVPHDAPPADFFAVAATHPVFELTVVGHREPAKVRTRNLPLVLIAVGAVTVAAHAALALAGVLGTGGWVSGIAIGLLVAGAGNHLRIFGRR